MRTGIVSLRIYDIGLSTGQKERSKILTHKRLPDLPTVCYDYRRATALHNTYPRCEK